MVQGGPTELTLRWTLALPAQGRQVSQATTLPSEIQMCKFVSRDFQDRIFSRESPRSETMTATYHPASQILLEISEEPTLSLMGGWWPC